MMKPLTLMLIGFVCLFACSHVQPEKDLEIVVKTQAPEIDLTIFHMPDSLKMFSSSYQVKYLEEGKIHLRKIPVGMFLIRAQGAANLTNKMDTVVLYKGGKQSILMEF